MGRNPIWVCTLTFMLGAVTSWQPLTAQTEDEPVGWRTDGSGKYSDAAPSAHWTDMHNQVWASPMPESGNATPILVKDRIFLCAEPDTIAAVDCFTGDILWQHANDYTVVVGESQWGDIENSLEGQKKLVDQFNQLTGQFFNLRMAQQMKPSEKTMQQMAALEEQIDEVRVKLGPNFKYSKPPAHSDLGYTSPTPASDGKHVYVLFGTGIVACYDLDGNRKWIKLVQRPDSPHGQTASPIIVDGKLIVHINEVIALDLQSGAELWRAESEQRFGTPVAAKIGDQSVIFTPSGDAISGQNGKIVSRGLGNTTFSTPIIHDNLLMYIDTTATALQLPSHGGDQIEPKRLWTVELPKDRYCSSPVYHRGVVYAVTQAGQLTSIDAQSGEIIHQEKLKVGGRVSPSITVGGKWLYVGDESGKMLVLDPSGGKPKLVTENLLEPHRASPVFSRDRMYLRGLKTLYCVGGDWTPPAPGETRLSPAF